MTARSARGRQTVLVAHPGAELYGSDRVMLESVAGFVDAGWRVVVTLCAGGPLVPELERVGAEVRITRSPVLRKSALRPIGFLRLLADTLAGTVRGIALIRRERPNAVYVSTMIVPLWSVLARLTGRPVLSHVHEAEGSASPVLKRLLALPLLTATRIVANSRFSVDVLRRSLPALARRMSVVYNGVPGPAEVVPPRAELTDGVRIVYLGRLSERKGVDIAVEAVAALRARGRAAELDVVGAVFPGYEWFEARLRELISELDLGEVVRLRGFHPSVWPFLAEADVAVVPSRVDEPFGNTAVEALLAARPVVVSATSGLREAAGGYASAQQVTPGDPDALADAIVRVVDGWPQVRLDALADADRAGDKHRPERYRTRLAEELDRLLPSRRSGRARPVR